MKGLSTKMPMGIVGGSDYSKISEQMRGEEVLNMFEYVFCENGLVAYRKGKLLELNNISKYLGEEYLQKFINFCLAYMSKINLPLKRGTFIEYRNGMLNLSPIGRNCTQVERDEFEAYDKIHEVRKKLVESLRSEFGMETLQFSIGMSTFSFRFIFLGGQISIDVFPTGWNKSFCLKFLKDYQNIYFYGDKTYPT
ncbi:unnamed protein product [Protopolystoma xenopodis]|uniref:Phosphomannomutase n=1 Tax=Protopolystoma xenopodis TaxID=117903 RepID=A0A448WWA0_9PLAT|nr:unnamed protein product [Protopolystoma xenopodis]